MKIELINESTVLFVMTILLGYTDGMLDPVVGSNIGFLLVSLILMDVLFNLMLFFYASGRVLYYKFIRPLKNKLFPQEK